VDVAHKIAKFSQLVMVVCVYCLGTGVCLLFMHYSFGPS
jgi:hypothetical protein